VGAKGLNGPCLRVLFTLRHKASWAALKSAEGSSALLAAAWLLPTVEEKEGS